MKRLKSVILGATISSICAFTIGASFASRKKKSEDSEFIWLEGMDLTDELLPLFDEGDYVYVSNSSEYWGGTFNPMEPVMYEVKASKFDAEDETYRYKLRTTMLDSAEFTGKWVAEEWLDYATKPRLAKEELTIRLDLPEIERSLIEEEKAKISAEIDYWLDTLLHSPEEQANAESRLIELTKELANLDTGKEV